MAAEEKKVEPGEPWLSGWRKIALWLVGAALLAIVGYRGALGSSMAGAAPLRAAGVAADSSAAPSTTAAPPQPPAVPSTAVGAVATGVTVARPPPDPSAEPSPPPATEEGAATAPAITPDGKIILNLATEVELRKLPGIGRSRARAILDQRQRMGRFRRLEDLLRVKGIGRKRIEVLRPKVVLDAP